MRTFVILAICVIGLSTSSLARADSDTMVTARAGKLTVTGEMNDMKILFNGRQIRAGDGLSFSFVKKYQIGDRDVVLVMNNSGGTACPAQYFFISANTQGDVKLSKEFGSCSDLPKIKSTNDSITVNTPKPGGRGSDTAVYKNDIVTINGQAAPLTAAGSSQKVTAKAKAIPGVGVHPHKVVLSKAWKQKFMSITNAKFQDFVDRLEVAGDTQLAGDWLVGSGMAPHSGGSDAAAFAILVTTGQVFGAMLEDGKGLHGFGFSSWQQAPKFLLDWAHENGLR